MEMGIYFFIPSLIFSSSVANWIACVECLDAWEWEWESGRGHTLHVGAEE
jgi:hypothetical protein